MEFPTGGSNSLGICGLQLLQMSFKFKAALFHVCPNEDQHWVADCDYQQPRSLSMHPQADPNIGCKQLMDVGMADLGMLSLPEVCYSQGVHRAANDRFP